MVNPKSVVFVNRVYPPVGGATGVLLSEVAEYLSGNGWTVTVITSLAPGLPAEERLPSGVFVKRVNTLAFGKNNLWVRGLAYLALYPALLWKALRLRHRGFLVTKTDPPLQLLLGPMVGLFSTIKLVHWAQDVYPDVAVALNVFSPSSIVTKVLRLFTVKALKRQDRVIAIGRCMKELLEKKGVSTEKIQVIPNWADTDLITPLGRDENPFRGRHELDGQFVVMYSGNMGRAHLFDEILEAAEILKQQCPGILFLFVGDGPQLELTRQRAAEYGLDNVRFLPFQDRSRLSESLSAGDLHLVTLNAELNGLIVPSKVYGVLAAGRPCLFIGPKENEAARILMEHQCGDVMSRPDGEELARMIREWAEHPEKCIESGLRARKFSLTWNKRVACERFEQVLQEAGTFGETEFMG